MLTSTTTNEMAKLGKASQKKTAPDGLAFNRNGLGPEHVIEIQRARLLAAMVEVCLERGIGNVSVAHVVQRAGVSRRTFYEIFVDREDCFIGAFDEVIERVSRYVLDAYETKAKWIDRIRAALAALLSFLEVEGEAGRFLLVGSPGAGPQMFARRQHLLAQIILVIDEGRRESKAGDDLPTLTAEGTVGGVLSVLHSRLSDTPPDPLLELTGPLMSLIVLPYLGPAAARKELARPIPRSPSPSAVVGPDPLRDLGMRLTYRTVRVLMAVAAHPGGSNRQVADGSGIGDQGQISKLLARLHGLGLIENAGTSSVRGAPNSWVLSAKGWQVQGAIARETT